MFLIRKIGGIVRGAATLPQIVAACVLGAMLGFVPGFFLPGDVGGGFMQAPGTILTLVALVLVIDANLAVFGLALLVAKLVSFLLLPVSFEVGRLLLEGPTEPLFRWLVNAPVFAWFGLERYATTGGLLVGAVFGAIAGLLLWKALHSLRTKMAAVEVGSERYQKLASKRSVKLLTWVFLGGGRGKKTWGEIAASDRRGKGVRLAGLAAVAVLGAGVWLAQGWLASGWLEQQARVGLLAWNGATVDLAGVELDVAGGRVACHGLAMADADRLDEDAFRARSLELDVATTELLAGRVVVQRLVSGEAESGVRRDTPGVRIEPVEPPPAPPAGPGRTIDEYLKDAKVWKERLQTAAEWLERLGGGEDDASGTPETPAEREERIEFEAETLGLANVVARHLIGEHPAVTVRELAFDGMRFGALGDDLVDVTGSNLSSHPGRATEVAVLSAKARSGRFAVELRYDPAQPGRALVDVKVSGVPVDALAASLKDAPIRGGTIDLALAGAVGIGKDAGPTLELPLVATLHGTTMTVGGKQASLDGVAIPLGLSGPLAGPRILVDGEQIADVLVAAGRQELANEVRSRADALLGDSVPGAGAALAGLVDGTKTPEQLAAEAKAAAEAEAKRLADEAKRKAEEAAKQKAAEELEKRLPGGLGGILGGKKQ